MLLVRVLSAFLSRSSPPQDQHVTDAASGCASMSVSVAAVPAPQVLGSEDHSPATAKWLKLLVLKVQLLDNQIVSAQYIQFFVC
jgi:predicted RNA methylase